MNCIVGDLNWPEQILDHFLDSSGSVLANYDFVASGWSASSGLDSPFPTSHRVDLCWHRALQSLKLFAPVLRSRLVEGRRCIPG